MSKVAPFTVEHSGVSQTSVPSYLSEYGNFINGQWTAGSSGETIQLLNPTDNTPLTTIAAASKEDVRRAIEAAHNAFPSWSQSSPSKRQAILYEMGTMRKCGVPTTG